MNPDPPYVLAVLEVKGRKSLTCFHCGREIRKNEYKTKMVCIEDCDSLSSQYSCCKKPHQIKAARFAYGSQFMKEYL